jgi:excisionase family DNA binding protein
MQVLTVAEVSEALRCSPDTVNRLINGGRLSAIPLGKRKRIVTEEDLAAFLRKRGAA